MWTFCWKMLKFKKKVLQRYPNYSLEDLQILRPQTNSKVHSGVRLPQPESYVVFPFFYLKMEAEYGFRNVVVLQFCNFYKAQRNNFTYHGAQTLESFRIYHLYKRWSSSASSSSLRKRFCVFVCGEEGVSLRHFSVIVLAMLFWTNSQLESLSDGWTVKSLTPDVWLGKVFNPLKRSGNYLFYQSADSWSKQAWFHLNRITKLIFIMVKFSFFTDRFL